MEDNSLQTTFHFFVEEQLVTARIRIEDDILLTTFHCGASTLHLVLALC